ncbi:YLP motif-containing protein 1-like [Diprion similis]|uniref:YLP motif-containing protein 1-like n=1 Tax=Diprion similis TaxID=362088 RepID=UPI001EF87210|nr:YLP motif-containing protein 1-like [Diprion similis]
MAMFYYYLPALLSLATALNPTSQTAQTHPQQQQQVSQNEWDRIDVNKMDKELTSWLKRGPDVPYPIQPIRPPQTIQPNPPTPYPDPQPGPTVLPEGCLAPRGQFASWSSCSSYLNCWDGIVIEQECPGGLLFNEYKGYCDFSDNVYCGSRPVATPQPELQPGSNVCPTPNGQYRSSTNCSEFYVCVYGKPIMRHCPRGLVYNEVFGICDYLYRVDCRGAAEPAPWSPPIIPHPPHHPYPPTPPPSYYPPQPQYPSTYPPQHHPVNPWLSKGSIAEPDLWNQSPVASSWEKQQEKDKEIEQQHQLHLQQGADIEHSLQQQEAEKPLQTKPWDQTHLVPTQLEEKRCTDGEVHRLNNSCSSVVVCRNGHLLRIECPSGLTYDKPSDSCKPSTIAKWSV